MMRHPIVRHAIGLGLFAVFTAGLIAVVHTQTLERAQANADAYAARTLYELVPETWFDQPIEDQPLSLQDAEQLIDVERLALRSNRPAFRALRDEQVTAVVLPVTSRQGYTGDIDLLVAVSRGGEVLGVRVVAHQETPGLGDAIEADRSDWVLQFDGTSLSMPPPEQWAVRKDGGEFDQLTGATITPRAVVTAVRNGLDFFADNREWLLAL
ncbi:MAG: electron transport complex subunit RsxG [Natronospirillum sp.]|uniref:electron transport complex subunit RsxG n=1 Tax=Natronospirillum sp. TaxID=2812955 RepID=UPI0025CF5A75|nr:electron transport complex subunit RsxG [Natronospirillum sp.]MCH8553175.1 electron transport complex subunit RsxG [Natronospirillum sp.]